MSDGVSVMSSTSLAVIKDPNNPTKARVIEYRLLLIKQMKPLGIFCVGLGGIVAKIPMAALVAVMILVSVSTFDWHSIMLVTVAGTVATSNVGVGVGLGVLTAMIASDQELIDAFDYAGDPPKVIVDLSRSCTPS